MSQCLHLYPVLDEVEAPARVSDGKIHDPAAQHRIDDFHHPIQRLRAKAPKDLFELAQQRRPLFKLRRILRSPYPFSRADTAKIEPQKTKAFAAAEVYDSTLLLVD